MKILWADECPQGSPAWWTARQGIPTASNFDRICTPAKGLLSTQAEDYAAELCSDIVAPAPNWLTESLAKPPNPAMRYGQEMEPSARRFYAMDRGMSVQLVGFVTTDDGRFGCSPDGFVIGDGGAIEGGLELKCPLPKTHAAYLLKGTLPLEYRCQVHGSLLVTGLPWWDFMSYCEGMEPLLLRIVPDEFTAKLAGVLDEFFPRYMEIRRKLIGTSVPEEAPCHP